MGGATDYLLLDAVRRRLRHPAGWLAVCLHLSRVEPPGLRPHHRLIARVLMEDTARRYEGEVYTTGRGDLLLLCQAGGLAEMGRDLSRETARDMSRGVTRNAPRSARSDVAAMDRGPDIADAEPLDGGSLDHAAQADAMVGSKTERVASPEALPTVLARLLRADIPDAVRIISLWSLDTDSESLLACIHDQAEGRTTAVATRAALKSLARSPVAPQDGTQAAEMQARVAALGLALGSHVGPLTSAPREAAATAVAGRRDLDVPIGSSSGGFPAAMGRAAPVPGAARSAARAAVAGPVRLQTGMILSEQGVRPLFREVTTQPPATARNGSAPGEGGADPFLTRYVARQADRRILLALEQASGRGGPLDPLRPQAPPLHINLSIEGVTSDLFTRLARPLIERGHPIATEIPLLEAVADPDGFETARRILRQLHSKLILDEVSPLALRLVRAAALQPDMVKLAWSSRLVGADAATDPSEAGEGVLRLLSELGPDRVILGQTTGEDALRWGLAHGIRRFQGPQVDAMLRAARMTHCAHAGGCTPAQCLERAAAATAAARRLCWNHPLLDGDSDAGAGAPHAKRLAPEPAAADLARGDLARGVSSGSAASGTAANTGSSRSGTASAASLRPSARVPA